MNLHEKPLLSDEEIDLDLADSRIPTSRWRLQRNGRPNFSPCVLHFAAFVVYSVAFLLLSVRWNSTTSASARPSLIYSPAAEAVLHEKKMYQHSPGSNSFSGLPRDALDMAWHNLMANTIIRVSADEVKAANTTSIPLHGGGFPVALSVYHELHCVKKLRQSLHPEYYYPDETEEEKTKRWHHNDHCLEVLRHTAMCHGDISIYGFEWHESHVKPATLAAWHECVNWDTLEGWAAERRIEDVKKEWNNTWDL